MRRALKQGKLGKKRWRAWSELTPKKWDIVLLGKLADAGLIETRQIPHHGPIGYEWQYRAVSIDQS